MFYLSISYQRSVFMNKKFTLICCSITVIIVFSIMYYMRQKDHIAIMAITQATPVALAGSVPSDISLKVDGLVKREYEFSGDALNALVPIRIRTREISPKGELVGTYGYTGIPVLHLLEGVAPEKPKDAAFNRPLDLVVTFGSSSGKTADFSYGELLFVDDALPVTLAFNRMEIKATKEPEKYDRNIFKKNVKGLRLISPRDSDTARYLDDVVTITLREPVVEYSSLPKMKKGEKCKSDSITCVWKNNISRGSFTNVSRLEKKGWFKTGHGRGFKGISDAEGHSLRSFLRTNFPGCGRENYFLFVACDGYRSIFSGREIFESVQGRAMMILGTVDGKKATGGIMLAPVDDYFVDRDVWGLTHIVVLDGI